MRLPCPAQVKNSFLRELPSKISYHLPGARIRFAWLAVDLLSITLPIRAPSLGWSSRSNALPYNSLGTSLTEPFLIHITDALYDPKTNNWANSEWHGFPVIHRPSNTGLSQRLLFNNRQETRARETGRFFTVSESTSRCTCLIGVGYYVCKGNMRRAYLCYSLPYVMLYESNVSNVIFNWQEQKHPHIVWHASLYV